MVICLERTIFWQERLHVAAADCWRICRQHLLQMAVKQEKQDERAAVNQKAEKLLKDYGNSILRMAYAYLHNMSDAEDILQETLIKYLQTAPVLENPAHEKAWLLKVAANLSKNRIDYNRIQITYRWDSQSICFRQSQGQEDNSGDYTHYAEEKLIVVGKYSVTFKGQEKGSYMLATWSDGTYSFSVSATQALKKAEFLGLIEEIEKNI